MPNIVKRYIGKVSPFPQTKLFESVSWRNEKILKHQEDQHEKKIILSGLVIFYKRPYEILHTYKELFKKQLYKFKSATTSPLIYDCGSNIGLSVLYFKTVFPEAEIHAFEPDEGNFSLLEKNCRANGLTRVHLHNAAVWIHSNGLNFNASASEASHISNEKDEKTRWIKSVRLRELLDGKIIDFLKIDIEGAEHEVLKDITPHLCAVSNLFLEYHGKTSETNKLTEILSIIAHAGFLTYIENAANNLSHPFFDKTTPALYDLQLNIFCYRN